MNRSRLAALLLFGVFVLPLWAADSGTDELERNARLLEKWRADRDHFARLQHDLQAFAALPRERQEKLRQFDRELHECDSETQKHLWETLERYAAWLDQLPEAEQQQILSIADKHERIQAITQKREQQWLERLPAKDRDYLKNLPDDKRPIEMARLHKEDRQRRLKWLQALKLRPDLRPRPSHPKSFADFPPEVIEFVNGLLTPMLNAEEKDHLKNTQGWPALAQTIFDLSEKHPVLPSANGLGPIVRFEQLPVEVRKGMAKPRLEKTGQWTALVKHEGRWPEYALAFTELATKNKHILSRQVGACKPAEFPAETEAFIKERLLPTITPVEAERLRLTEDKWPAYPKLLHELAKKYNLVIPGMSLPGPRELWESARTASLPEVPDHMLREFVGELSQEELTNLNLSPMDPSSRDRLRQEFFRRHPKYLRHLRELDTAGNKKR
jgi:hypothetical protein